MIEGTVETATKLNELGIVGILVFVLLVVGASLAAMSRQLWQERRDLIAAAAAERRELRDRVEALSADLLRVTQEYADAAARFAGAEAECQRRVSELSLEVERMRVRLERGS